MYTHVRPGSQLPSGRWCSSSQSAPRAAPAPSPQAARARTARAVSSTVPGSPRSPVDQEPSGSCAARRRSRARRATGLRERPSAASSRSTATVAGTTPRCHSARKPPSRSCRRSSHRRPRASPGSLAGTPASCRTSSAFAVMYGQGPSSGTRVLRTKVLHEPRRSWRASSPSRPRRSAGASRSPCSSTSSTARESRTFGQPLGPDQVQPPGGQS